MQSRKAVSNIVLMLGIVLAMAILLIGGAMVVVNLVESRARASPEFIATDLVTLINTVQAAPESATYNYYTEQDDQGYPIIGSLEIDDDSNELCVHQKTEYEIMGSIAEQAGIAAGFGAAGYAYGRTRLEIASHSNMKLLNSIPAMDKQISDEIGEEFAFKTTEASHLWSQQKGLIFGKDGGALYSALLSKDDDVAKKMFFGKGVRLGKNIVGDREASMIRAMSQTQYGKKNLDLLFKACEKSPAKCEKMASIMCKQRNCDTKTFARLGTWLGKGGGKDLGKQLVVGKNTGVTTTLQKFLAEPEAVQDLRMMDTAVTKSITIQEVAKDSSKSYTFLETIKNYFAKKVPWSKTSKLAAKAAKFRAAIGIKAGKIPGIKLFSGKFAKVQVAAFGVMVIGVGVLTGDWEQSVIQGSYIGILFGRKFIAEAIARRLVRASASAGADVGIAHAFKETEAGAVLTASIPGTNIALGMAIRAIEASILMADSIINTYLIDSFIIQVLDASGNQVQREKDAIACKNFMAPKQTLLTPPNCAVELENGPAVAKLGANWPLLQTQVLLALSTSSVFQAVCIVPSKPCATSMKVYINGFYLVQGALIVANIASKFNEYRALVASPGDIIPTAVCKPTPGTGLDTCDKTYLRQDCPNWYISDPGGGEIASGTAFFTAATTGPICTGLSWFDSLGPWCNLARYVTMGSIIIAAPGQIFGFFLRGYEVGFTKPKISAKSAPQIGVTDGVFSDNEGFWYAEMPYAIEMTKIYTSDSSINNRTGNFVIRKV